MTEAASRAVNYYMKTGATNLPVHVHAHEAGELQIAHALKT
jgi:hypothetical protein